MATVYVLVEMADIELLSVRVFSSKKRAVEVFHGCSCENQCQEFDEKDMAHEIDGTLMMAGDDSYSVSLVERGVK